MSGVPKLDYINGHVQIVKLILALGIIELLDFIHRLVF
jgi:hypothetical protein